MRDVELFGRHADEAAKAFPGINGRRLIHETVRRMINSLVTDLLAESKRRIEDAAVITLDDVHAAPVLIGFSNAMHEQNKQLKSFLHDNLYRHYQVLRMTSKARRIIADLFGAFMSEPRLLPPQYQQMAEANKPRAIADYVAGMTDRYAMKEHRRLFAVELN